MYRKGAAHHNASATSASMTAQAVTVQQQKSFDKRAASSTALSKLLHKGSGSTATDRLALAAAAAVSGGGDRTAERNRRLSQKENANSRRGATGSSFYNKGSEGNTSNTLREKQYASFMNEANQHRIAKIALKANIVSGAASKKGARAVLGEGKAKSRNSGSNVFKTVAVDLY